MPHTPSPELLDRLACPQCAQALDADLSCTACTAKEMSFPVREGVPWLVAEPDAAHLEWKNRWQMALKDLEQRQQAARAALGSATGEPARLRLETLADGYAAQHRALKLLLADLGLAGGVDLTTYQALRTRLPTQMGLMAYEANVFRDWVWGGEENQAALGALEAALAGAGFQSALVLGSGAGRLAYDLHETLRPSLTVALELNPYLSTLTRKLADGETINLVEFPLAPDRGEHSALLRALSAPAASSSGFEVVLADVMRPPFRDGSFELIVTPWLLDVIDGHPADLLGLINRMLVDGGRWLFQGSLAFQKADPARNINLDELQDIAAARGFEVAPVQESEQPYLNCPESRHGRRERIITFAARKVAEAERVSMQQTLPDWLAQGLEPIPALPAFQNQAMATRIHAFIMSLIDGQRSLKDMAEVMEAQQLMPKAEAEVAIRGFLIKMFDEAGSDRGL